MILCLVSREKRRKKKEKRKKRKEETRFLCGRKMRKNYGNLKHNLLNSSPLHGVEGWGAMESSVPKRKEEVNFSYRHACTILPPPLVPAALPVSLSKGRSIVVRSTSRTFIWNNGLRRLDRQHTRIPWVIRIGGKLHTVWTRGNPIISGVVNGQL